MPNYDNIEELRATIAADQSALDRAEEELRQAEAAIEPVQAAYDAAQEDVSAIMRSVIGGQRPATHEEQAALDAARLERDHYGKVLEEARSRATTNAGRRDTAARSVAYLTDMLGQAEARQAQREAAAQRARDADHSLIRRIAAGLGLA